MASLTGILQLVLVGVTFCLRNVGGPTHSLIGRCLADQPLTSTSQLQEPYKQVTAMLQARSEDVSEQYCVSHTHMPLDQRKYSMFAWITYVRTYVNTHIHAYTHMYIQMYVEIKI